MRKMLRKQLVPDNQLMSLREYREYAEKIYGRNTINEFMLRVMNIAALGRPMTRKDWDKMQVGIKLKNAEIMGR